MALSYAAAFLAGMVVGVLLLGVALTIGSEGDDE